MKKNIYMIIFLLLVFLGVFVYKYNQTLKQKETNFVIASVKGVLSAFGITENDILIDNTHPKNIYITIDVSCNFNIKQSTEYILDFFDKEKYKTSFEYNINKNIIKIKGKQRFLLEFVPERPLGYIAIIIDDVGYNINQLYPFFDLGIPLTFAVFPKQKNTEVIVNLIRKQNYNILLHQPMQSYSQERFDKSITLLVDDPDEEIVRKFNENMENLGVGNVIGMNNHTGSKFTENIDKMSILMDEVKKSNIFFIDSKTTPKSVAKKVAKEKNVVYFENDVFLDNEKSEEYIMGRLDKAMRIALKRKKTLAIGHVYDKNLVSAIQKIIPICNKQRIKLIKISEIKKYENSSN